VSWLLSEFGFEDITFPAGSFQVKRQIGYVKAELAESVLYKLQGDSPAGILLGDRGGGVLHVLVRVVQ
jgi:hypothetical protein